MPSATELLAALDRKFADPSDFTMTVATYNARRSTLLERQAVERKEEQSRVAAERVRQAERIHSWGLHRSGLAYRTALAKSIDPRCFDDARVRVIEGVASTPAMNTHGYALESALAEFELPIPLLVAHDIRMVVGRVVDFRPSVHALTFRAEIARGELADQTWMEIVRGNVPAVSTAFTSFNRETGAWQVGELSVCERGACPGARILFAGERRALTDGSFHELTWFDGRGMGK